MQAAFVPVPTFRAIRARSKNGKVEVYAPLSGRIMKCVALSHGLKAIIDFDLWKTGQDLKESAQSSLSQQHSEYLKYHMDQFPKADRRGGLPSDFNSKSIRFAVLASDADTWFNKVYSTLENEANLVPVTIP